MRRSLKAANPFYALLIIAGLMFAVTATAYVVMAFREAHARDEAMATESAPDLATDEHPLMAWMRQHGTAALLTELALLAIGTFAAIGTDGFWQRRAELRRSNKSPSPFGSGPG